MSAGRLRVRVRVRDEALGDCWRSGPWTTVIIRGQPMGAVGVVGVVSMRSLVVVTCTGRISMMLLMLQEWPPGSEAGGPRP
jgi:hypothetical protein